MIDAEGQYEGKYAAAERYMRALRARIGAEYPVALAAFPYVDYHPAFPYSVFFAPEGAQYNQPQMYWKAIGTSVRGIYEHTYLYNRVWGKPLYPLGQTYMAPARSEIVRFRRFAENYGGAEVSWWAWHETNSRAWGALAAKLVGPVLGYQPIATNPVLKRGSSGDLVVWAQMHLRAAGRLNLPITGIYGKLTTSRGPHLPGRKGPSRQRRDRPDDLARTPRDRTGPAPLGGAPGEAGARRGGQQRGGPAPPALGLAAGQGLRDRSWLRSLSGPEIIPGRAPAAHPSGA